MEELYKVCFNATLLDFAIKYRVDFFELLRSTSLEEYNRENPLCPLPEFIYDLLKNKAKEINNGQ